MGHFAALRRSMRAAVRGAPRLALVLTSAAAVACADAPTYPTALQWLADGDEWLAVLPPASLPASAEWVRQGAVGPAAEISTSRVAAIEAESDAAFARGDLPAAARLRRDAARVAIESVVTAPSAGILLDAATALDLWTARVQEGAELGDAPALLAAVDSIAALRAEAATAAAAGDSVSAARALISAGERVRSWSPTVVAVRMLARAEATATEGRGTATERTRAAHLVRGAREALQAGDPLLAVRRAMYALQVAEGRQIADPRAKPR